MGNLDAVACHSTFLQCLWGLREVDQSQFPGNIKTLKWDHASMIYYITGDIQGDFRGYMDFKNVYYLCI